MAAEIRLHLISLYIQHRVQALLFLHPYALEILLKSFIPGLQIPEQFTLGILGQAPLFPALMKRPYFVGYTTSGIENISLTVNSNGCPSTATQNSIVVANLPAVNAGSDETTCAGTNVSIGINPTAGISYSWSPASGLSSPNASQSIVDAGSTNIYAEVRQYILQASSALGCINTDTVLVTINPIPVLSFTRPGAQCLANNSFRFYLSEDQHSWRTIQLELWGTS